MNGPFSLREQPKKMRIPEMQSLYSPRPISVSSPLQPGQLVCLRSDYNAYYDGWEIQTKRWVTISTQDVYLYLRRGEESPHGKCDVVLIGERIVAVGINILRRADSLSFLPKEDDK